MITHPFRTIVQYAIAQVFVSHSVPGTTAEDVPVAESGTVVYTDGVTVYRGGVAVFIGGAVGIVVVS